MKRLIVAATAAFSVSGCVGPSASLRIAPANQVLQAQSTIADVAVLPAGAVVLGSARGVSCKNKMWDPSATESAALAQLKVQAAVMGGRGVAGVTYAKEGTTVTANCWEAIYASGTVYK